MFLLHCWLPSPWVGGTFREVRRWRVPGAGYPFSRPRYLLFILWYNEKKLQFPSLVLKYGVGKNGYTGFLETFSQSTYVPNDYVPGMGDEAGDGREQNSYVSFPDSLVLARPIERTGHGGRRGQCWIASARPKPSAPQHPDWQGFTTQNKAAAFGAHANFRFKATPRREGKSWAENGVVMGVGGRQGGAGGKRDFSSCNFDEGGMHECA